MAGRGIAQGGFQRSALKSLLRGEPRHRCVPAWFAGGQRARRGGNPPAPAFPGGETGKGRSDSSLPQADSFRARSCHWLRCSRRFRAPAPRTALEHVPVMEDAVQQCSHCRCIAQQVSLVFHRAIRRQQGAGAFVAAHHDLQQILSRSERQLTHAEIVDDEQRYRRQRFHELFS